MLVDYHMHLRSPREDVEELEHTVAAVERFVARARERGVNEIGFTEHGYYFRELAPFATTDYERERCSRPLEPYVEAIVEAKRQGLPVKLGLEVDFVRGREEELREALAPFPWDYLLGSVHWIGGAAVDQRPGIWADHSVEAVWRRYFDVLASAAASGLFDALSHPDLVKIWGVRPANGTVQELYERAAEEIAAAGVAAEISSAGLRKPVGELYPNGSLLAALRERGVPITLASDAHLPKDVGEGLDRALEHARAHGYETVTVFDARHARQEPLG
ncbi:MAG TPA: histidinol-phosphatase HisJ family protein [Gaiellaceae bacterium]|nr:histidinol-phosphatase HisJ family protein [Gaiellaceae bacterium]